MPGCSICNNPDGKIEIDEHGSTRQCACSFRAHCQKRLPPDIAGTEPILTSPLLHIGRPGEVIVDLTTENLFIKSWWADFAPHLLMALTYRMLQNLMFPFRITNDAELRDVYVGSKAYTARSRQRRDEIPTYNGLADFIEIGHSAPSPNLVGASRRRDAVRIALSPSSRKDDIGSAGPLSATRA